MTYQTTVTEYLKYYYTHGMFPPSENNPTPTRKKRPNGFRTKPLIEKKFRIPTPNPTPKSMENPATDQIIPKEVWEKYTKSKYDKIMIDFQNLIT